MGMGDTAFPHQDVLRVGLLAKFPVRDPRRLVFELSGPWPHAPFAHAATRRQILDPYCPAARAGNRVGVEVAGLKADFRWSRLAAHDSRLRQNYPFDTLSAIQALANEQPHGRLTPHGSRRPTPAFPTDTPTTLN